MVLCIIAFFVFAVMSIFSARYRPLAKEAFRCVLRTVMLKPCDTGLDEKIKVELVSSVLKYSPTGARTLNKHFSAFSWIFVILTIASFGYMIYGAYNFYYYGNCDGPESTGACILNDITGDYGRFSEPKDLIAPTNLSGIEFGNPNGTVTIVEFGCFTCPYTKKAESIVETLLENPNVRYIFKPFPLPNHQYSKETAKAVLCATEQGKHWEFREAVFEQQEACVSDGRVALDKIATRASLDKTAFDACMNSTQVDEELEAYIKHGKDAHIYATPTFFINGRPIIGPRPIGEFEQIIREEENA